MKKDIIYIDVEDDITAIIGKVKDSNEKIIALVPPKRVGVLQSAVNLRLLQRAAEQNDKRIVLITSNQALSGLAAAASIPIARNLQSKPELAEIPALEVDDGEDVIDGSQLPVGEHAKQATSDDADDEADLIEGVDIEQEVPKGPTPATIRPKKTSGAKKVPNFGIFRKRLVLIIAAAVLLIGGLVWAIVFAPSATIIVTARTTEVTVNDVVTFGSQTNAEQGTLKSVSQKIEKENTIEFSATGEKDVGEKATGTVRFSTGSIANLGLTIPAGTSVTSSSGKVFTTTSAVTFNLSNYTGVDTGVVAAESGPDYNGADGSVGGAPSGVSASFTGPTSGGTTKMVPIVTAADVQKAKERLVEASNDEMKKELEGKFASNVKVIAASFNVDYGDVKAQPAIGEEVSDKKATLVSKTVYTLTGVEESELTAYLEQTLKKQMQDQTTQKIYESGMKDAQLNEFTKNGKTLSVRLVASGQIGPIIDENEIKAKVAGKRFGEVREDLTKINGVSDVDVKFSFFWVRTVPSNQEKITVEFNVHNASE